MITKIKVEFALESLVSLSQDEVESRLSELLDTEASGENWFQCHDAYALFVSDSLKVAFDEDKTPLSY